MTRPVSQRLSGLCLVGWLGLAGCSTAPPTPSWQINARDATERATAAYLDGNTRVADAEFARARTEASRSARADQVARVDLARCAAQLASLVMGPCGPTESWQADMGAPQQAYQRYLSGHPRPDDLGLLPAIQRPVAHWLLAPGTSDPAPLLLALADPLSRLVAAGVLMQAGQASPAVMKLASEAASDQGWRRPLLAWLGLMARHAAAAGDADEAQRLQRRMDLLAPLKNTNQKAP